MQTDDNELFTENPNTLDDGDDSQNFYDMTQITPPKGFEHIKPNLNQFEHTLYHHPLLINNRWDYVVN